MEAAHDTLLPILYHNMAATARHLRSWSKGLFGSRLCRAAWHRQRSQAHDFVGLGLRSLPGAAAAWQGLNQTAPKSIISENKAQASHGTRGD